jgi:lipopolysaccharide transport system ATP-binding protein
MSEAIIRVENLGKKYILRHQQSHRYVALRDVIAGGVRSWASRMVNPFVKQESNPSREEFWALKDVSFEVNRGDRVGIIGRNGAGKSTLLKLLSRITEPTTGRITLKGRVASLLEVGTGFHPELTGRENIFLNGAILGMSRVEIQRKFDEIVAFAEVEKFLDTPVKHYSSGMYVRLAFAVAAHLEPEILVVDEVLAVGDAQFQKKCLGKMGEVSTQGGRTIFFVSHNMTAVQSLCDRVIWLNSGDLIKDGSPQTVISDYLTNCVAGSTERIWHDLSTAPGNEYIRLYRVATALDCDEKLFHEINVSTPIKLEFEYWNFLSDVNLNLSFVLYDIQDICIFNAISPSKKTPKGLLRGVCHIPGNLLNDGTYRVRLLIVKDTSVAIFDQDNLLTFTIGDIEREGSWYGKWIGAVRPNFKWDLEVRDECSFLPLTLTEEISNV